MFDQQHFLLMTVGAVEVLSVRLPEWIKFSPPLKIFETRGVTLWIAPALRSAGVSSAAPDEQLNILQVTSPPIMLKKAKNIVAVLFKTAACQ